MFFNRFDFDRDWAAEELGDLLTPDRHVAVLPLLEDEGWASDRDIWRTDYIESEEAVYAYRRPFLTYGIQAEQIRLINYYEETAGSLQRKLDEADILVLVSDHAGKSMHLLNDYDLADTLRAFDGPVLGIGQGANLCLDRFNDPFSAEQRAGLSYCSGFALCMHYEGTVEQLRMIIDSIEVDGRVVVICPAQSGIVLDMDRVSLLGDTVIAGPDMLNRLYELLEDAEEERGKGSGY